MRVKKWIWRLVESVAYAAIYAVLAVVAWRFDDTVVRVCAIVFAAATVASMVSVGICVSAFRGARWLDRDDERRSA